MITREELLKSKEYWLVNIQNELFNLVDEYLEDNNINSTQFAEKLGVTKGYISQILNGDFNHRISKLVELSLAIGKAPKINFIDIEKYIDEDNLNIIDWTEHEKTTFKKNISDELIIRNL